MMERRVKERLIGATLLVVLIVLIVPEMLSGPRQPSAPPLTVGLPAPTRSVSVDLTTSAATPEPNLAEAASAPPPPSPPPSPPSASPPPATANSSGWDGTPAAASNAAGGEGRDADSESAPPDHGAPLSSPTVTTLQAQQPTEGPAGRTSAAAGGSTLETPPSGPKSRASAGLPGHRGWAVQLGSFASRTNAERLMHQLQARGGASPYVSASGSGPALRYRVRMGPLTDRGAAEREAGRLRAEGHPSTVVAPNS